MGGTGGLQVPFGLAVPAAVFKARLALDMRKLPLIWLA